MKKEYIKPSLNVMSIPTSNILAGSETMTKSTTEVDGGSALSKENRIIIDDFDED